MRKSTWWGGILSLTASRVIFSEKKGFRYIHEKCVYQISCLYRFSCSQGLADRDTNRHTYQKFQNIFPLVNSLAGTQGTRVRSISTFVGGACPCHIFETRLYFEFKNRKPHVWKKSVSRDIWAQSWQSRLFLAFFFGFSDMTSEIFMVEENFCLHKYTTHRAALASFHFSSEFLAKYLQSINFFDCLIAKKPAILSNLHVIRHSS